MIDVDWLTSGPWTHGNAETDTEYKVKRENEILYITFQGNKSKTDWLMSFAFWPMYKNMREPWFVHAGFRKKYHSIRDDLLRLVQEEAASAVWLTGVSGGVPMAALAMEDINYHFNDDIVAFGDGYAGPRFLWLPTQRIANRWEDFTLHHVGNDAVTKAPPSIFGYRHAGYIKQYGERKPFRWDFKVHNIEAYRAAIEGE